MIKRLVILLLFCFRVAHAQDPDSLLKAAEGHAHDTGYVMILTRAANRCDDAGLYDKAIALCEQAVKLSDSLRFPFGKQAALNRMGNCYIDKGNVKKALECHLQVLKLRESLGLQNGVGYTLLNLGNIYFRLGEEENSLKSYSEALRLLELSGDSMGVATCLANMGSIYSNLQQPEKAEQHYLKALAIRKRQGNTDGIAEIYSNLSIVFMDAKKYKQALAYAFKTLDLYGESGNQLGKAISYSNIGDIFEHMNEYNNAIKYQLIAAEMGRKMKSQYMQQICYQLLAVAYQKKKDYGNALLYAELYSQTTDSMMNSENSKLIAEMQTKFETEKKEKEIELLQKDKNIRELQISEQDANIHRQRIIIYSVVGGLILVLVLVLMIFKSYREKKKINAGLEIKNVEIGRQKDLIAEKNVLITDSIEYARNIQGAILPSHESINKNFPGSFILFMPKDIVSGDLYWMAPIGDTVFFAAIDCTGHGVPGAFMSVMAYNMLENIVKGKKILEPAHILDELNKTVVETLHQESETVSAKFGMDISLVAFNRKKKKIEFAGAHNSLLVVSNDGLREYKADNATIGMARNKFTGHQVEMNTGDMLYLYTDGYADQKGGPENKKLYANEFRKLIMSAAAKDTATQKDFMHKSLSDWKQNNEQIDDILVVGIRV